MLTKDEALQKLLEYEEKEFPGYHIEHEYNGEDDFNYHISSYLYDQGSFAGLEFYCIRKNTGEVIPD